MAGSKSWREKKGGGGRERNLKILDNREVSLFFNRPIKREREFEYKINEEI